MGSPIVVCSDCNLSNECEWVAGGYLYTLWKWENWYFLLGIGSTNVSSATAQHAKVELWENSEWINRFGARNKSRHWLHRCVGNQCNGRTRFEHWFFNWNDSRRMHFFDEFPKRSRSARRCENGASQSEITSANGTRSNSSAVLLFSTSGGQPSDSFISTVECKSRRTCGNRLLYERLLWCFKRHCFSSCIVY